MNRTTKLVPIVLVALGAAGLQAQEPARATPAAAGPAAAPANQATSAYATRRLATLLEGISLAPAQRSKIDSVVTQYSAMLPATPPDSTRDSLIQERWRSMLPRMDTEIRLVLTPEQQQVWDRNVTAMRSRMQGIGD